MKKQDWVNVSIVSIGGLLLVIGLFWLGSSKDLLIVDYVLSNTDNGIKKTELEEKIRRYKGGNNNPKEFVLLGVELAAAQKIGLIQKSTLSYLNLQLEDAYKFHVYNLSEEYLKFVYKDNSKYIENLNHLEKSIGNNQAIMRFKDQIERVHYYEHRYPPMVKQYLAEREDSLMTYWNNLNLSKWQFPEGGIETIKYRLTNTQGLEAKYKNTKIKNINNQLLQRISTFENAYEKYGVDKH